MQAITIDASQGSSASRIIKIALNYWVKDFNITARSDYAEHLTDEQYDITAVASLLLHGLNHHQQINLTARDFRVIFHCLGRFDWALWKSCKDGVNTNLDTAEQMSQDILQCAFSIIIAVTHRSDKSDKQHFGKTIQKSQFLPAIKQQMLKALKSENGKDDE